MLHMYIFHTVLVKLCMSFNDSTGKQIMISDKIWQDNIFQHASSNANFVEKMSVWIKGNIFTQAGKC